VTLVCLLLINQHPSPIDDCPCFEDSVAFMSVILGIITSFGFSKRVPALNAGLFTSVTPGAAFDSPAAIVTWTLVALLKVTTGILVILAWRMLAKPTVQTLLPPLFRWLAHASPVRLPHRRHYTPATEYSRGPPHTLRAMPSMIDLAMAGVVDEGDGGIASGREGPNAGAVAGAFKRRGLASEYAQEKAVVFEVSEGDALEDNDKVKHYDADGMFDTFSLDVRG
jgi:dihydrosphingosine 1-phosphate phosphatase